MVYRMYSTEALVISVREQSSSDRLVRMFTEFSGMIEARAIAVREEKSKMRYALQPLSLVRVTLVRGKREWRITGVEPRHNLFFNATERSCRAAVVGIARTLERLVRGEEDLRHLFGIIADGIRVAAEHPHEDVERVLTLRILASLGYVASDELTAPLLSAPTLREALAATSPEIRSRINSHLEEAYAVSHL